jgi:hypothetical protein
MKISRYLYVQMKLCFLCFVFILFASFASAQQNPQYGSSTACAGMTLGTATTNGTIGGDMNGFVPFPSTNAWNTSILNAPVDPNSATLAAVWSAAGGYDLHPDFGGAINAEGVPDNGIPYIVVDSSSTPSVPINLWNSNEYGGNEDVVVAPYPNNVPIEGSPTPCEYWPQSPSGDSHSLVLDRHTCWLYELWSTTSCNGQYASESETLWDMENNEARPWGWTSADAAGLSVLAGLVKYDEAASGVINHAFRFTMVDTLGDANGGYFVLPAVHGASSNTTANLMPEGTRLRLRANTPIDSFSNINQAILTAMMNYGIILADNGGNFYIQGTADARWDDTDLGNWHGSNAITSADFDVVQMTPGYPGMDSVSAYTDYPGSVPSISSFTANGYSSSITVSAGTPITFDFTVSGSSYNYIDNIGPVRLSSGSGSVTITPTTTQEYTLYSTNASGQAYNTIAVYIPTSTMAAPVFTPPPGTYTATTKVSITTATNSNTNQGTYSDATIYYTTNGSTPTTASTKFNGKYVSVAATETLKAIAIADIGGTEETSAVGSAAYTINSSGAAPTPTFSPAAGSYSSTQTVTISDTAAGATIYYTLTAGTKGQTPTVQSKVYTGPISVPVPSVVEAIATASGYAPSAAGSATFSSTASAAAKPKSNLSTSPTYTTAQTITLSDTTTGASIYYTLDGTTPTYPMTGTTKLYSSPLVLNESTTVEAIAAASGYTNSAILTDAYTIELPDAATPTFSPAAGTYSSAQTVTLSDTTSGAAIYYTTNGTTPTTSSSHYTSPIAVSASETVNAIAVASGYNESDTGAAAYTIN